MEQKTVQERLHEMFVKRRGGMFEDSTLLGMLACVLRGGPRYFTDVRLDWHRDLLSLTDGQAEAALEILPGLDISCDPSLALRLLAAE